MAYHKEVYNYRNIVSFICVVLLVGSLIGLLRLLLANRFEAALYIITLIASIYLVYVIYSMYFYRFKAQLLLTFFSFTILIFGEIYSARSFILSFLTKDHSAFATPMISLSIPLLLIYAGILIKKQNELDEKILPQILMIAVGGFLFSHIVIFKFLNFIWSFAELPPMLSEIYGIFSFVAMTMVLVLRKLIISNPKKVLIAVCFIFFMLTSVISIFILTKLVLGFEGSGPFLTVIPVIGLAIFAASSVLGIRSILELYSHSTAAMLLFLWGTAAPLIFSVSYLTAIFPPFIVFALLIIFIQRTVLLEIAKPANAN